MIELKPCPFCGEPVQFAINIESEPYGVACMRCHTITRFTRIKHKQNAVYGETMEKIAAAWNRRTEDG